MRSLFEAGSALRLTRFRLARRRRAEATMRRPFSKPAADCPHQLSMLTMSAGSDVFSDLADSAAQIIQSAHRRLLPYGAGYCQALLKASAADRGRKLAP